ncbi:formate dehydrogenase accessory sulfurtransferase FdhD [Chloroflexota bacterium]
MNLPYYEVEYSRFTSGKVEHIVEELISEKAVTLSVNGKEWLTFMCTPIDLEALAVGFLFNEKVISHAGEVIDLYVCENKSNIDIWLNRHVEQPQAWKRTSGCSGGYTAARSDELTKINTNNTLLSPSQILSLVQLLFENQDIYKRTGGVHTSAISDGKKIILTAEDVGRHNTFDKIIGRYLLDRLEITPKIILSTGRISSEMLEKGARFGASVVISRTSATSLSVELASNLGITLIGYARGHRFNIYTHPDRVDFNSHLEHSVK